MSRDPRAVAKAKRYPELEPHPGYEYDLPSTVVIDGRECIEFDAAALLWARDMARAGERQRSKERR